MIGGRGDDFFDRDTNLLHFFGGKPVEGETLAVYECQPVESFVDNWVKQHGSTDGFKEFMTRRAPHRARIITSVYACYKRARRAVARMNPERSQQTLRRC